MRFITAPYSPTFLEQYGGFSELVISDPLHILPSKLWALLKVALDSHPVNSLIQCIYHEGVDTHCGFLVWKLPVGFDGIECITQDTLPTLTEVPTTYVALFPNKLADYFCDVCEQLGDDEYADTTCVDCSEVDLIELAAHLGDPSHLQLNAGGILFNPTPYNDIDEGVAIAY
jgi:hypothetical protein